MIERECVMREIDIGKCVGERETTLRIGKGNALWSYVKKTGMHSGRNITKTRRNTSYQII